MQLDLRIGPVPTRPTLHDVLPAALEELCGDFLEWDGNPDQPLEDTILGILQDAILSGHDGYATCSELESYGGVTPDSQLVWAMDDAYSIGQRHRHEAVCHWVAAFDIKPQHAVGDVIRIPPKYHNIGETAVITEIQEKYAAYVIGEDLTQEGKRYVVTYEEIDPLNTSTT